MQSNQDKIKELEQEAKMIEERLKIIKAELVVLNKAERLNDICYICQEEDIKDKVVFQCTHFVCKACYNNPMFQQQNMCGKCKCKLNIKKEGDYKIFIDKINDKQYNFKLSIYNTNYVISVYNTKYNSYMGYGQIKQIKEYIDKVKPEIPNTYVKENIDATIRRAIRNMIYPDKPDTYVNMVLSSLNINVQ